MGRHVGAQSFCRFQGAAVPVQKALEQAAVINGAFRYRRRRKVRLLRVIGNGLDKLLSGHGSNMGQLSLSRQGTIVAYSIRCGSIIPSAWL